MSGLGKTISRAIWTIVWSLIIYGSVAAQESVSSEDLILQAFEKFDDELAREIAQRIADETKQRIADENATNNNGDESIKSLFLGDLLYNRLGVGRFEGLPTITWNGFDEISGAPTFVFSGSDFAYITSEGRRIEPGPMNTDGGSVPQFIQAKTEFSSWYYGPAFVIHDWLFVAYQCSIKPDGSIGFEESAEIMAEAIKTLTEVGFVNFDGVVQNFPKREDELALIFWAVTSNIARNIWDDAGDASC